MCIIYKTGSEDVHLPLHPYTTVESIHQTVSTLENIPPEFFYLTFDGKRLDAHTPLATTMVARLHVRVCGGKGGFGSMLRAIGARIEKTTNHEACRDLSGRRMRDVNYEKEMGEWLKQQEQEKEDKEERNKHKLEKLQRVMNPTHHYQDADYTKNLQNNANNIDEALKAAIQRRDAKLKRKAAGNETKDSNGNGKQKKSRSNAWMGVGADSEDDDDDNNNAMDLKRNNIVSVYESQPGCSKMKVSSCSRFEEQFEIEEGEIVSGESTREDVCVPPVGTEVQTVMDAETVEGKPVQDVCEITEAGTTHNYHTSKSDKPKDNEETNPPEESKDTPAAAASSSSEEPACSNVMKCVDLNDYSSAEELEGVGLEILKFSLTELGLKCGGNLQERAQRLYSTKNIPREQLDPSLFTKPAKGKNKKQKKWWENNDDRRFEFLICVWMHFVVSKHGIYW